MITIKHIKPRQELLKYVRKISVFQSHGKVKYKQKLIPSAFTYLSYNHKDIPITNFGNKRIHPKHRLQIAGPKVEKDIYVEYNGKLSQILIEFTAPGFFYLFHHSPNNLINRLSEMNNFISHDEQNQLEEQLFKLESVEQQVKILEASLIDNSHKASPPIDYIERGLLFIEKNHGHVNVNNLTKDVGIGKRQFNRKFQEIVGISPKYYSKIMQLHYVINVMHSKNYTSMQDLAYRAEFYDLPHFANRFKELTGFTPNEFVKSDKHIALKYFTDLIK